MCVASIGIGYGTDLFWVRFVRYIYDDNLIVFTSITVAPKKKFTPLVLWIGSVVNDNLCVMGIRVLSVSPL